jgi:hypothetical protein
MRLRSLIRLIAVLGVLLHAGALVRHHGMMLGGHLQHQALLSDLAVLCHAGGDTGSSTAELPSIPAPTQSKSDCPVCSGQVSAFALAAPDLPQPPSRVAVVESWQIPAARGDPHDHAVCPPARGPPAVTSTT